MSALGVAVVGTGFGARVVAPAFAATDGVEVISVVSPRDAKAVAAAVRDSRVGLVSVHSPPFLHADHVRLALDAGRSVLCDKPFTPSAELSRHLVDEARDADGVQLLNFEFRFDPVRSRMRDLVAAGTLGTVEHVVWTHHSAGSRNPLRPYGWLFDRERGGGWIGAWASHAIDTLRFTAGEVEAVLRSSPRLSVSHRPDPAAERAPWLPCTAEDGLSALLALAGGATVTIDSSFAASATIPPRLVVVGSEAILENVGDRRLTVRDESGRRDDLSFSVETADDHHVAPMRALAGAVRDAVNSGDIPAALATFADGLACDEVLDRLRGEPISVVHRARI